MQEDNLFLPDLSPVGRHKIHARFDGGALSSDGGVLILREIEKRLNFAGRLASCLRDERDPTVSVRGPPPNGSLEVEIVSANDSGHHWGIMSWQRNGFGGFGAMTRNG
jgi:hypothetical protein